jgi:hypothetical protein
MIAGIADFALFCTEAIALYIALTVATYLIARAATAAYFTSQFEFIARLASKAHGINEDGTKI